MSNVGQAVLTIGGTIVGSFFGNPQLGFLLGSLAGSYLFPTQLPTVRGPRLEDLGQTRSTVGAPIPRGWGVFPVAGDVIAKSDLREVITTEEVGGKGGPTQDVETASYYQDFAVGLCEGEIVGIRRIWANGKIIYDKRPKQDSESDDEFNSRIAASAALEEQLVVYTGTETQLPDPTLETAYGVGNISAFRGLAYVVFINWRNKEEDGLRMPGNWKFEVVQQGSQDDFNGFEYANEVLYPWLDSANPLNPKNLHEITVQATGVYPQFVGGTYTTVGAAQAAASSVVEGATNYCGYTIYPNGGDFYRGRSTFLVPAGESVADADPQFVGLHYTRVSPAVFAARDLSVSSYDDLVAAGLLDNIPIFMNGAYFAGTPNGRSGAGVYQRFPSTDAALPAVSAANPQFSDWIAAPGDFRVALSRSVMLRVERKPRAPDDPCSGGFVPGTTAYGVDLSGILRQCTTWSLHAATYKVLQRTAYDSVNVTSSVYSSTNVITQYPLGPARPVGHPDYNDETFWTDAYNAAVERGEMEAGLVYNVGYPVTQDYAYRRTVDVTTFTGAPVSIADIVADLHAEAGYAPTDYDVTDLASLTVLGYVRTSVMAPRAAIEPLRSIGFFDSVESDGKIKYVRRGKATVATLTADDLAATTGNQTVSAITTAKKMDFELPRSVRVHYLSYSRDYELGEQPSPVRVDTDAVNEMDLELAAVLTDEQAARIAEVVWADLWASKWSHEIQLNQKWHALEPTDTLIVPVDGQNQRMRVVQINDRLPVTRQLQLVRDDDGAYVSTAAASAPPLVPAGLSVSSPVAVTLLDIPPLRDADDDAGMYAAARPLIAGGRFRGAYIFRSSDGQNYTQVAVCQSATPMGSVLLPPATTASAVFDVAAEMTVELKYGTLSSRTYDDVLNGANAFAVGAHGRWLICQFQTATLVTGNIWKLTGLVLGRRGTEHFIGTVVSGDEFVLLSAGTLARVPLENAQINADLTYKFLTATESLDSAEPLSLAGAGVALKPFSPVFLTVYRDGGGDLLATWTRRDRLSQELLDGAELPMSEQSEQYDVEVRVAGVVVNTTTVTSPTATIDLGSPISGVYDVRVHQRSAVVGRGTPAQLELTVADAPGTVTPEYPDDSGLSATAIVLPLVYDEVDQAVSPLTWTRTGSGPRVTPSGLLCDGYTSRLVCSSGLPAYATSNSGPLLLRAAITPMSVPNTAVDRIVGLGVNNTGANPRLEFVAIPDNYIANIAQVAVRAYTGSMQEKALCRQGWRFAAAYPEKVVSGENAYPQGIVCEDGDTLLVSAHYNDVFMRVQRINKVSGELLSAFQLPGTYTHSAAIARRDSDGSTWFADTVATKIFEVDIAASFASGTGSVTKTITCTTSALSAMEWVTIGGNEYLVIAEFLTSGTPYLYLYPASLIVNGATLNISQRTKRLTLPLRVQGVAYRAGKMYLAESTTTTGGTVAVLDFDAWVTAGSDGDAYTTYELPAERFHGALRPLEDIDFDSDGVAWMLTEGYSVAGDDFDYAAVWSSEFLTTPYAENTFQAYYESGNVGIAINDKPFCALAWTPSVTPGAIYVGGAPTATPNANFTQSFFAGRVRNIVLQDQLLTLTDYYGARIWELDGFLGTFQIPVVNPGAEDGASTGWTVEVGTLSRDDSTPSPAYGAGSWFFNGGTSVNTRARQRFTTADLGIPDADIDSGLLWATTEWLFGGFSTQADSGVVGFRFLDSGLTEISLSLPVKSNFDSDEIWRARSYGVTVPANTRYIDVVIDMERVVGTNNDGYVDEIRAAVHRKE